MAVISVRLNSEEEKMVEYLSALYDEDKSTLIKHSLIEMYEDIVDKKVIDDYEKIEKKKRPSFIRAEDVLVGIKKI
jgi:hypothetical protein